VSEQRNTAHYSAVIPAWSPPSLKYQVPHSTMSWYSVVYKGQMDCNEGGEKSKGLPNATTPVT